MDLQSEVARLAEQAQTLQGVVLDQHAEILAMRLVLMAAITEHPERHRLKVHLQKWTGEVGSRMQDIGFEHGDPPQAPLQLTESLRRALAPWLRLLEPYTAQHGGQTPDTAE